MNRELEGRVAVVTGGGKGIGAAIVQNLAAAGAHVAAAGRDEAALAQVTAAVRQAGGRAFAVRCDVAQAADVAALADRVRAEAGPAHIVVANAGIARSAKFESTDEELWAETMAINLTGSYRLARAFYGDVMAAGPRGRIVFIASVAAKIGFSYTSAYCASKHGVLGLARALAHEIGARGPTVNCVCPGWVDTDMAHAAIGNIARTTGRSQADAKKELERMSPQRRLMTAQEIAAATLFLCSDAGRAVNGQGLNVDGGEVMS